jgi:hypothetical protein
MSPTEDGNADDSQDGDAGEVDLPWDAMTLSSLPGLQSCDAWLTEELGRRRRHQLLGVYRPLRVPYEQYQWSRQRLQTIVDQAQVFLHANQTAAKPTPMHGGHHDLWMHTVLTATLCPRQVTLARLLFLKSRMPSTSSPVNALLDVGHLAPRDVPLLVALEPTVTVRSVKDVLGWLQLVHAPKSQFDGTIDHDNVQSPQYVDDDSNDDESDDGNDKMGDDDSNKMRAEEADARESSRVPLVLGPDVQLNARLRDFMGTFVDVPSDCDWKRRHRWLIQGLSFRVDDAVSLYDHHSPGVLREAHELDAAYMQQAVYPKILPDLRRRCLDCVLRKQWGQLRTLFDTYQFAIRASASENESESELVELGMDPPIIDYLIYLPPLLQLDAHCKPDQEKGDDIDNEDDDNKDDADDKGADCDKIDDDRVVDGDSLTRHLRSFVQERCVPVYAALVSEALKSATDPYDALTALHALAVEQRGAHPTAQLSSNLQLNALDMPLLSTFTFGLGQVRRPVDGLPTRSWSEVVPTEILPRIAAYQDGHDDNDGNGSISGDNSDGTGDKTNDDKDGDAPLFTLTPIGVNDAHN